MPARPVPRPATRTQLQTGTLVEGDPVVSRLLSDLATAQQSTDKIVGDATPIPGVFTALANGLAPKSGGGAVNFLRADGAWAAAGATGPAFTGSAVVVPPQLTASHDDWTPVGYDASTGTLVLDANSGAVAITGLTGGAEGRLLLLIWKLGGTSSFTLSHDTTSIPANRFNCPAHGSVFIDRMRLLYYTQSRWNVM